MLHEEKGGPAGALGARWRKGGKDVSSHLSHYRAPLSPEHAGSDQRAVSVARVAVSCYWIIFGNNW